VWLARTLTEFGPSIRPDDIVMRSSFVRSSRLLPVIMQTRTSPVSAGCRYTLRVEDAGEFLIKDEVNKLRPKSTRPSPTAEETGAKQAEKQTVTARNSSQRCGDKLVTGVSATGSSLKAA
jgi:hypothetical protein